MMAERLNARDFEEAVDFFNLVFSQNGTPHDFKKLQPRCMRPEMMEHVYAVRRDGRIRAAAMAVPSAVRAGGDTLRFYGVGNVATHIDERGAGLMSLLLEQITREEPADYSGLGGYRQRYGHFGYEVCGTKYAASLSARNVRLAGLWQNVPSLRPVSGADDPAIREIRRLYESKMLYVERGDDAAFWRHLSMWTASVYAAYSESGDFMGYLCADGATIREYGAVCPEALPRLFAALIKARAFDTVDFQLAAWEWRELRAFASICEGVSIVPDRLYRISSWDRVSEAFLKIKAATQDTPDGEAVLEIDGWGRLAMRVHQGVASCEKTALAASLRLDPLQAARLLFGPLPPLSVRGNLPRTLAAWLPLPFSWNRQDNI